MRQNEAFDRHFSEVYGARWPGLREALLSSVEKTVLQNPFGLENYALDGASLCPVRHLDIQPGLRMADLCASPGGKSLAAIFSVRGEGEWFCNDLSPARVARLKAILHDCLPPEVLARVQVFRGDASRWGLRFKETFERVLVDAPCSGERHLLASPKELARWTLKSGKRLSIRQHALLCAGYDSLVPGGRLVYSTCSVSPLENDGVIEKLLKSRPSARVLRVDEPTAESTRHGHMRMPDRGVGGPIYFAVIAK